MPNISVAHQGTPVMTEKPSGGTAPGAVDVRVLDISTLSNVKEKPAVWQIRFTTAFGAVPPGAPGWFFGHNWGPLMSYRNGIPPLDAHNQARSGGVCHLCSLPGDPSFCQKTIFRKILPPPYLPLPLGIMPPCVPACSPTIVW